MKSGNKLNKALKDALDGNPAPLNESQWARIESELSGKRRKPFVFWLLLLIPMLTALGIAYYSGLNKGRQEITSVTVNSNSVGTDQESKISDNAISQNNAGNQEAEPDKSTNKSNPAIQEADKSEKDNVASQHSNNNKYQETVGGGNQLLSGEPDKTPGGRNTDSGIKTGTAPAHRPVVDDPMAGSPDLYPGVYSVIANPAIKAIAVVPEVQNEVESDTKESSDSLRKRLTGKEDEDIKPKRKRFAIGFASGLSFVSTDIAAVTNEKKLHKDTRSLFEQSTRNQHSSFANVIFEWMPFKALTLGIHSGIQYRSVSNRMDIDYKLNQIPMRDMEGNISFYIPIHDTMNPPTISVRNTTAFRFVNIPLCLNYGFMAGKRDEIKVMAGLNFSLLAGSSGNTFSLNEAGVRPVGEMISNIFDMGYTGGLMYSRNVYGNFWLGTEMQMQNNRLDYDMDYGILKSRIRSYNLNLNLRYKF